jgi:hypothetical protein
MSISHCSPLALFKYIIGILSTERKTNHQGQKVYYKRKDSRSFARIQTLRPRFLSRGNLPLDQVGSISHELLYPSWHIDSDRRLFRYPDLKMRLTARGIGLHEIFTPYKHLIPPLKDPCSQSFIDITFS